MISVIELQVRDISRSPHFTYEITTPALYQLAYTEIKQTTETGGEHMARKRLRSY